MKPKKPRSKAKKTRSRPSRAGAARSKAPKRAAKPRRTVKTRPAAATKRPSRARKTRAAGKPSSAVLQREPGLPPLAIEVSSPKTAPAGHSAGAAAQSQPPDKGEKLPQPLPADFPFIPPILLEGDEPNPRKPLADQGPTETPTQAPPVIAGEPQPLPCGSGRLFLVPREPHVLYAHWDLTMEQQRCYNEVAAERHLLLRIYHDAAVGAPLFEVHLHPESQHWFVHVEESGANYVCELGYHDVSDGWRSISVSQPARTPAESLPAQAPVQFVTLPLALSLESPLQPTAPRVPAGTPEALVPPEAAGQEERRVSSLPAEVPAAPGFRPTGESPRTTVPAQEWTAPAFELSQAAGNGQPWTPQQERALAEFIESGWTKTQWPSSAEIAQLLREQAQVSGPGQVRVEQPSSPAAPFGFAVEQQQAVSSPMGGPQVLAPEFWFNVNAELIIYGATQPDATVTIGGRTIRLRPDGTFSFRFALPDGQYQLPLEAVATYGERRQARLAFHRATSYRGEVGEHPQSPELRPPNVGHVG